MLEIIRWSAAGTGILAGLMMALNLGARTTGTGFAVFALSSVCWIAAGLIDGTMSIVVLNAVMLLANILGIYRWLWLSRVERDGIVEAKRPAPSGSIVAPR